jgi:hypothetical protein
MRRRWVRRRQQRLAAPSPLVVVFVSGGFGVGSILVSGLPVCRGSIAMVAAASVGLPVGGKFMTFRHLLVQFRPSIIRGGAIAR